MFAFEKEYKDCWDSGLVTSSVPPSLCSGEPIMMGIDEAGRGPALGPMTYGAAFWRVSDAEEMEKKGFDDSKALSAEQREKLFEKIKQTENAGWLVRVISACEISASMLRRNPYSLNALSHDTAIKLVQTVRKLGVNVSEVYVDTVGDPAYYEKKLGDAFHGEIAFTVRKKADSLFKVVSAASICAKVTRDQILEGWKWKEKGYMGPTDYGSGYPSDQRTVDWLEKNRDPLFGYPNIVRFSWATITTLLTNNNDLVEWGEDEAKDAPAGVPSITSFFQKKAGGEEKPRTRYFTDRHLSHVSDF